MPVPKKEAVTHGNPGVTTKVWFWASDHFAQKKQALTQSPEVTEPSVSVDQKVQDLLTGNPGINGATFLNLLKTHGIQFVDGSSTLEADSTKDEADSASSNAAVIRAGVKKEAIQDGFIRCRFAFREGAGNAKIDGIGPTRFDVTLIKEGLGNFKDAFYYTKESLESAIPLFEGRKAYADHPTEEEEQIRPERSVRDIIGHYENVKVVESEDGCACLQAELCALPDKSNEWARARILHAIDYAKKYPDKDFVGLSINAGGDAEEQSLESFIKESRIPEGAKPKLLEALNKGVTTIRRVDRLDSAVSADLVTEAGAKGRVNKMIEQEKKEMAKDKEAKKESEEKKHEGDAPDAKKHDDADEDQELIAKMLAKYLGDGHDDETKEKMKQAYEGAKEMGLEGAEAEKMAGYAMKMAKHMAGKQSADPAKGAAPAVGGDKEIPAKESDTKESENESESEKKKESGDDDCDDDDDKNGKKESNRLVTLTAENVRLKESLKKFEIEKFLEKALEESKLPRAATKKFRECVGTAKTEKEITDKLALFKEAYSLGGEADGLGDFVLSMEKNETKTTDGAMSFADCVE